MGKVWWIDLLQAAKGLRMSMLFFLLADLSIALALGAKPDACLMHKTSYSGSIWAKARAVTQVISRVLFLSPQGLGSIREHPGALEVGLETMPRVWWPGCQSSGSGSGWSSAGSVLNLPTWVPKEGAWTGLAVPTPGCASASSAKLGENTDASSISSASEPSGAALEHLGFLSEHF